MKVDICIDNVSFTSKPDDDEAKNINYRIAALNDEYDIEEVAQKISQGYSWSPATFTGNRKIQQDFKSQQLFALDFDRGISIQDAINRAYSYNVYPVIIYETFSSKYSEKFRIVFCHCSPIYDVNVAKVIQNALVEMFPEADKSSKDISKLYYGGNKGIYLNGKDTFNIYDLLIGMTAFLEQKHGATHIIRHIKSYCNAVNLVCQDNYIKLFLSDISNGTPPPVENNINGNFRATTLLIYRGMDTKLPYLFTIYFTQASTITDGIASKNNDSKAFDLKPMRNFKFDELTNKCKLFFEWQTGTKWLDHNELFGVLTNLINIKGGQKVFIDVLNQYPQYYERKVSIKYQVKYAVKNCYKPMSCRAFCPYANECEHSENLILTVQMSNSEIIRINGYEQNYYTLKEAQEDIKNKLYEVIDYKTPSINILKAQTGVGKTFSYLNLMENSNTPCIIAVPTNKLKLEVYNKARNMGINVVMTPSIEDIKANVPEIKENIELMYSIGAEEQVTNYLREWSKENENALISNYLKLLDKAYEGFGKHIITTHAKYVHIKPEILDKYINIIDEDIINTIIQIQKVAIEDIKAVLDVLNNSENTVATIYKKLRKVISKLQSSEFFKLETTDTDRWDRKKFLDQTGDVVNSNVLGILKATHFYYNAKEQNLYYIRNQILDKRIKYIILSATANEMIYKKCFKGFDVKFIQCKKTQYLGQIIQYHDKTYSRYCINNNPEIYKQIKERLNEDIDIITFKNYNPYAKKGDIYFGATEGHNELKGKDIAVIGTPHKPEFLYKLMASFLEIDVSGNLYMQEIEYQGCRFRFNTFENEELRNIQLWVVNSELEQSIGRARAISCEVKVHLFSNLPVEQAVFTEELNQVYK